MMLCCTIFTCFTGIKKVFINVVGNRKSGLTNSWDYEDEGEDGDNYLSELDVTDMNVSSAKTRFTTKCCLKLMMRTQYYTEGLLLYKNSTKKVYKNGVIFKSKYVSTQWSENVSTEINYYSPNNFFSEAKIILE